MLLECWFYCPCTFLIMFFFFSFRLYFFFLFFFLSLIFSLLYEVYLPVYMIWRDIINLMIYKYFTLFLYLMPNWSCCIHDIGRKQKSYTLCIICFLLFAYHAECWDLRCSYCLLPGAVQFSLINLQPDHQFTIRNTLQYFH